MFVFWGMPEGLILTGSTFDEDCGKGTEDERLNAAAEPVEIQTGKGRDADLEQLDLTHCCSQKRLKVWMMVQLKRLRRPAGLSSTLLFSLPCLT